MDGDRLFGYTLQVTIPNLDPKLCSFKLILHNLSEFSSVNCKYTQTYKLEQCYSNATESQ